MSLRPGIAVDLMNERGRGCLPDLVGFRVMAVTRHANGKTIALFRCTQLILWPKS
jgi:hypothetical protein